jgi:hypothetical protein
MGMDFNISAEKNMPRGKGGVKSQESRVKSQESKKDYEGKIN